jgi:hypothetical protein
MDHDQGRLARLDTLPDFTVADGDPDVRGWKVVGPGGDRLGEVMHLIVDPAAMAVRYVEVELAPGVRAGAGGARRVLVHVEDASIDEARHLVIVREAAARAGTLPPIPAELASGESVAASRASGTESSTGASADTRETGSRFATGSDGEIRVVLMREELVITKRLVAKEEIVVRKRAVTEERIVEADLRRERLVVERQGATSKE